MDIRHPIPTNGGFWLAKFGDLWKQQVAQLQEKFGAAIEKVRMPPHDPTDVPIIYVKKDSILDVLRFLKEGTGFKYGFLSDITATDEESEPRFEVVYQLFSHEERSRIRVKVRLHENEDMPSAVSIWKGANWAEREVYDMFGIKFNGHPDLRRILMDSRWKGHPLRKDYPIRGYQVFTDAEKIDPSRLE